MSRQSDGRTEKRPMVKSLGLGLLFYMVSFPLFAAQWQGVLDWSRRTELTTAVSGVVGDVSVVPGERVKKGQLLLVLEQEALRARLVQYRAEVKYKKLLRDEAARELERAEELYARTLLADHDLNLAKVAYAEADAVYQAGRADVRQAEETLRQSRLTAPFDALVLDRLVQPSETVISRCQAAPLLVIAASGEMLTRFTVGEEALAGLAVGQAVTVEANGQRYNGKILSVGYEPKNVKGDSHYQITAVFPVAVALPAGQTVTVSLP